MRAIFTEMAQFMTTQAQVAMIQAQDTMTQANQDVSPRPYQQVTTVSTHIRKFTRMNPPIFYGSMFDEDPQEFLDEVYKVLYDMGVTSS